MNTTTQTGHIPKTETWRHRGVTGLVGAVLGLAVTVAAGAGFVAIIGAIA